MKLTFIPGKFYKTRDGRKVKFLGDFSAEFETKDGLMFVMCGHPSFRYETGSYHAARESDFDIVSEWKEPVTVSGWVNVYPESFAIQNLHSTQEKADQLASANRIACIFVQGTEGEEPV